MRFDSFDLQAARESALAEMVDNGASDFLLDIAIRSFNLLREKLEEVAEEGR